MPKVAWLEKFNRNQIFLIVIFPFNLTQILKHFASKIWGKSQLTNWIRYFLLIKLGWRGFFDFLVLKWTQELSRRNMFAKARPMKPGKGIYLNLLSREYYQNDFLFWNYPLEGLVNVVSYLELNIRVAVVSWRETRMNSNIRARKTVFSLLAFTSFVHFDALLAALHLQVREKEKPPVSIEITS